MTKRKQIKVIGFRNMAYFSLLGTLGYEIKIEICPTRISGPDGPLILAVVLRNTPKGGGYGRTDPHTALYI